MLSNFVNGKDRMSDWYVDQPIEQEISKRKSREGHPLRGLLVAAR